jgi:hypothetical protein
LGCGTRANSSNREKLVKSPDFWDGNIDLDDLCSQLQRKAKSSGDSPVINEEDFKEIMHKSVMKGRVSLTHPTKLSENQMHRLNRKIIHPRRRLRAKKIT